MFVFDWSALMTPQEGHPGQLAYIYALIKKKKNFLICKEIQMGAVANSYIRKGFLIYEEAVSHI